MQHFTGFHEQRRPGVSPGFAPNAGFNVMVPGAQANACREDRLFADGFEND